MTHNRPQRIAFMLIATVAVLVLGSIAANAQDCPPDKVCLDREHAAKYLAIEDENKALKAEIAAKDQAAKDLKDEIDRMRLELAKAIGEKTGSEQMVVRLTAIVDVLVKNTRKKSIGLIAF